MAGTGTRFVFKTAKFFKDLRARAIAWAHPAVPLRIIGQYITEISKQAFDKQADPATGAGWAPLHPEYAAYKRKHRRSPKALIFTGKLKRSIGYSLQMGKDISSVVAGPADEKGKWHQYGTGGGTLGRSGGGVNVPARPFLGLSPTHEKTIRNIIANHLRMGR